VRRSTRWLLILNSNSAPSAPSGISIGSATVSALTASWTDNSSNETGFELERSANGTTGWANVNTTAADATSYQNTGLTDGTTYYYRVRAASAAGYSPYSDVASGATSITAPTNLSVAAASSTSLQLSWTNNSATQLSLKVERSADGVGSWSQIGTTAFNAVSYLDTELAESTTYYYRIRASNGTGDSAYTSVANAATSTIYYFDGSDAAASDPGTVWTNDANAVDATLTTYASCSTNGSDASNFLMAEGTNAPGTGASIANVYARVYYKWGSTSGTPAGSVKIYTDALGEVLGTVSDIDEQLSPIFTAWLQLVVPSGGWSWAKVQALEFKGYRTNGGVGNTFQIGQVQVYAAGV
jgi:hypothetical protein